MTFLDCDVDKLLKRVGRPFGNDVRHPAKHPDFPRLIVMQLSAILKFW